MCRKFVENFSRNDAPLSSRAARTSWLREIMMTSVVEMKVGRPENPYLTENPYLISRAARTRDHR